MFVFERGPDQPSARTSDGAAILLLHGFPTSAYDWRGVVSCLEGLHQLIAPDFLGFGLSDKPVAFSYSLFEQADMLEQLLARLDVPSAHVVSHDMGTSVHCELLARQAERRLRFELRSSTFLNGSMLQWMAKITPFQEMLASNATLPQAIEFCRTALPAMYVAALQGLMKKPEVISAEDARTMDDLTALSRWSSASACLGRLHAQALHPCRSLAGGA